ncbi:HET-domain-containing protein [Trichodelitschia bisporula]|uniref:HET-domain-containing protein n=1 Tax=Trichodelitschia bisporula TaxID=703511 RepID=A0A6G1HXE8_9PEZI|nr:HET-domain-containing protein [Trichodelitschia bisporula]
MPFFHTWLPNWELTLQDLEAGRGLHLPGYEKIRQTCAQATLDGLAYVWIDTCCIDKSSSAELSEAINSMFRWYAMASICYAFLEDDVPPFRQRFLRSRYFTRGWTLQELLAPKDVIFYDRTWNRLGSKHELGELVSDVTGIDQRFLQHRAPLQAASVAARMSWASKRQTTRVEDTAYCLIGIFDVYMPLIYGEGQDAFIRLQEAILDSHHDTSLLAWVHTEVRSASGLDKTPVC